MRLRPILPVATGLLALSLTACAAPSVILQCPAIPRALTAECVPEPRPLVTNGDLARALTDSRECVVTQNLQLRAIAELADCRAEKRVISKTRFFGNQRLAD